MAHFHSNSDWTASQLLLTLISAEQVDELTVIMPSVDVDFLRTLAFVMAHLTWVNHLTLITQGAEQEEIKAQLHPYADKVTVVEDVVSFRAILLKSTKRYIVVQGSINLEKSRSMQAFTVTTTQELYNQFMETISPRIRVGKRVTNI